MIKIIAFLTMLLDHLIQIYFPNVEKFDIVGRISFPLFAYGISKGVKLTKNYKFYVLRLLIIALISQIPYYLLFKSDYLNVCFTLLLGALILKIYELKSYKLIKYIMIFMIIIFVYIMNFEYGIYGIAVIIIFYIFDNKYFIFLGQLLAAIFGIIICRYYNVQIFSILAVPLLVYVKKYDFKMNKILQYSFYPGHMILIWIFTFVFPVN